MQRINPESQSLLEFAKARAAIVMNFHEVAVVARVENNNQLENRKEMGLDLVASPFFEGIAFPVCSIHDSVM